MSAPPDPLPPLTAAELTPAPAPSADAAPSGPLAAEQLADSAAGDDAPVRVGVLTVSDRASRGEFDDLSGPAIQAALPLPRFVSALYACVPDDRKLIYRTLRRWCDDGLCDCILTTGGTGLAERDVTPEATARVLERQLPHLASYLALEGARTVPTAVLSRGVAGARGRTLIVNLPGSPGGAAAGARLLAAIIPHAVAVLHGRGAQAHARAFGDGHPSPSDAAALGPDAAS